jgi:predicted transcriptional regulator
MTGVVGDVPRRAKGNDDAPAHSYAHERQVIGTLLLNLLFAIFEHNEPYLKRHFGASLETMTVGIAVLLSQMASRPASVVRVAQLLGVPWRIVVSKLRELAAAGAVIKKGGQYVVNYEIFAATDQHTAAHINRLKEAILVACEKLGHSDHQQRCGDAGPTAS